MARRCGAEQIFKSKCTKHTMFVGLRLEVRMSKHGTLLRCEAHFKSKCLKHTMFGPLLEVGMWKNGTPLWRGAHFQVKMHETQHVGRTTFGSSDVKRWHTSVARSTYPSPNVKNMRVSSHFGRFRCRKSVPQMR